MCFIPDIIKYTFGIKLTTEFAFDDVPGSLRLVGIELCSHNGLLGWIAPKRLVQKQCQPGGKLAMCKLFRVACQSGMGS